MRTFDRSSQKCDLLIPAETFPVAFNRPRQKLYIEHVRPLNCVLEELPDLSHHIRCRTRASNGQHKNCLGGGNTFFVVDWPDLFAEFAEFFAE